MPADDANTAARIRLVHESQGGLLARLAFRESRRRYGRVMDQVRVMAHQLGEGFVADHDLARN